MVVKCHHSLSKHLNPPIIHVISVEKKYLLKKIIHYIKGLITKGEKSRWSRRNWNGIITSRLSSIIRRRR